MKRLFGLRYACPLPKIEPQIELRERREYDLELCVKVLRLVHEADLYPIRLGVPRRAPTGSGRSLRIEPGETRPSLR